MRFESYATVCGRDPFLFGLFAGVSQSGSRSGGAFRLHSHNMKLVAAAGFIHVGFICAEFSSSPFPF